MFVADGGGTAAWTLSGGRLRQVWRNGTGGTSPVVAGGLLYVYDPGGSLRVYAPGTGRQLAALAAGPGHWNSPIVVAGRIAPYLANPANRALIKPEALWEYDQASQLTGEQTYRASVQRSAFYQKMLALFERYEFLALPSAAMER